MSNIIDPKDIFIRGKSVLLKCLTKEDVLNSGWYGWFNDENICKTLQKHYFPNYRESQYRFWENEILNSTNKVQLGICRSESSVILGVISLNNIDLINRKAEISAVIGEKEGQNVGIFCEACMLILNHGFATLGLNRIYGGSISRELVVLMCRALGFKEEGVGRMEIYKDGQFHNSYRYGILKEEFTFKL